MKENKAQLFLRLGLAFVFIYVAISAYLNPTNWIGFIPDFVIISKSSFLIIHSIFNLALGLWLLSNKKIFYASIVSAIALFSITIFNLGAMDIVFRDIGLLLAAIALAYLSK